MIVVPVSALAGLSPNYVEALLAHELAHIRRADYLVNVIQSAIETLLFYHPAVWWLSRQIRLERELCCDDLAAATCDDRVTYAHALASLEELRAATPALAMAADGGELLTRIRRLLEPGSAAGPRLTNLRGFAMGMVVIVLLLAVNGETTGRAIGTEHPALPIAQTLSSPAPAPLPVPTSLRSASRQAQAPGAPAPQGQTGVAGRVMDGTGGTIPGATITVSSPTLGRSFQTVTNAAGRFVVPDLAAGVYSVTVNLPGFKTARVDNVIVTPPGFTNVSVRLELGTLSESVTIAAPGVGSAITQPQARPGSEYFDLAKAYYEQGRYAEAEQAMTRALEMVRAAAPQQPAVTEQLPPTPQPSTPGAPQTPIRVGGDIREPRKIKDVKPVYPPDALAAQVSGVVILEATVAKDGTVRDVRVLRSIPMLDAAAIDAVSQWQFTPTQLNGMPVEVLMTVTVNFTGR
jgi:TonB family protein